MKRQTRIESQHKEEHHAAAHEELSKEAVRDFATPEEMLRHDALHTPVPPKLAERLRDSIGSVPAAPRQSWWRKLLGLDP